MTLLRFLPHFREAQRAMPALEARENWSRNEIEAFQLERLNTLWAQATAHVPHYRRMAQEGRLPARFPSLAQFRERVPVLPKATVRDNPQDFLSERAARGEWRTTSGSTGRTTGVFWSWEGHRELLRAKYRLLASWGVDFLDRTVFLWGNAAALAPGLGGLMVRVKGPVSDWLRDRLRLSAYRLGRDDLRSYLRRIIDFKPSLLYGYAAAIYLLAGEGEQIDFSCASLKLAMLTAEPVFPHFVSTVEHGLRVPAVQEYGSSECGFLAGEGRDRVLRVREDMALLETLPREDGRYDIVVSVLTNPSFPLLRYAIGDVTDAPLDVPQSGFAALTNVAGRNNDFVISGAGRLLHPNFFDGLFQGIKYVRRWRVHQRADGSVWVGVESLNPALDLTSPQQRIEALVEGQPVELVVMPELPPGANGKHRWIHSDLATPRPRHSRLSRALSQTKDGTCLDAPASPGPAAAVGRKVEVAGFR